MTSLVAVHFNPEPRTYSVWYNVDIVNTMGVELATVSDREDANQICQRLGMTFRCRSMTLSEEEEKDWTDENPLLELLGLK